MKVFLPSSMCHLATCLPMQMGACEFGTFSDGEVRVRVNEDVRQENEREGLRFS